jgi:hypothetical protein
MDFFLILLGEGSELEDVVHKLWRGDNKNVTSWEFGSYSFGQVKIQYNYKSNLIHVSVRKLYLQYIYFSYSMDSTLMYSSIFTVSHI